MRLKVTITASIGAFLTLWFGFMVSHVSWDEQAKWGIDLLSGEISIPPFNCKINDSCIWEDFTPTFFRNQGGVYSYKRRLTI